MKVTTQQFPIALVRLAGLDRLQPRPGYEYGLGLTSQFYFCGLPLRLDAYSTCAFSCSYCFAHARGGAHRKQAVKVFDAGFLDRKLDRVSSGKILGVVDEFLARRQPIHFGGMSDPFSPLELKWGASHSLLGVLASHSYPTVISTKSDLLLDEDYLAVLKRGNFVVQISLSSMDEALIEHVDRGTPGPTRLLKMVKRLSAEGIPTFCRIQPVLPGFEGHAGDVVSACAEAGVRHVAVEHLKLAVEDTWGGNAALARALKLDLRAYFRKRDAIRVGREWVLGVEDRLANMLKLRSQVRRLGLSFGAADNDLLLFSDASCCCSGVDLVPGFDGFFRHTYLEAARSGLRQRRISLANLAKRWAPDGSIAMYMNSHSRIDSASPQGAGVRAYIERNWNGSRHGNSPMSLFGLRDTLRTDERGFKLYEIDSAAKKLILA